VGAGREDWRLYVTHDEGAVGLGQEQAVRTLGFLLARLNQTGGTQQQVVDAVELIDAVGGPDAMVARAATLMGRLGKGAGSTQSIRRAVALEADGSDARSLAQYEPVALLALEMAVHEERERRVLAGELEVLEREWREAEEVAGIVARL
jgi:hypothetical protein